MQSTSLFAAAQMAVGASGSHEARRRRSSSSYSSKHVSDLQDRVEKLMVSVMAVHCDLRQNVHKKFQPLDASGEFPSGIVETPTPPEFSSCPETPGPAHHGGVSIDSCVRAYPESIRCAAHGMWRQLDDMVMTATGAWVCAPGCKCGTTAAAGCTDAPSTALVPPAAAAAPPAPLTAAPRLGPLDRVSQEALHRLSQRRSALEEDFSARMSEGYGQCEGSDSWTVERSRSTSSCGGASLDGSERRAAVTEHIRAIMAEAWTLVSERTPRSALSEFSSGGSPPGATTGLSSPGDLQAVVGIDTPPRRKSSGGHEDSCSTSSGTSWKDFSGSDSSSNAGSETMHSSDDAPCAGVSREQQTDIYGRLFDQFLGATETAQAVARSSKGGDGGAYMDDFASTSSYHLHESTHSTSDVLPPFRLPERLVEELASRQPSQTAASQRVLDAVREQQLVQIRSVLADTLVSGQHEL